AEGFRKAVFAGRSRCVDAEKRARYTYPEPHNRGAMPRFVGFGAAFFAYSVRGSPTRTDASHDDSVIDQPTPLRDFPEARDPECEATLELIKAVM
uniref:hypothetical protein n=1 Tax=Streptomyces sp. NRRL F-5135 TaxID=1463858 RepID=UPI001F34F0C8